MVYNTVYNTIFDSSRDPIGDLSPKKLITDTDL